MVGERNPSSFWSTVVGGAAIMFLSQWGIFSKTPAGALPGTVGIALGMAFLAKLRQHDIG